LTYSFQQRKRSLHDSITIYHSIDDFIWSIICPATAKKVFTFAMDQDIDPIMNRRVKLAMDQAEKIKADVILIQMDTYGGCSNGCR
jgi:membrane-bound ClpP family serine protease